MIRCQIYSGGCYYSRWSKKGMERSRSDNRFM